MDIRIKTWTVRLELVDKKKTKEPENTFFTNKERTKLIEDRTALLIGSFFHHWCRFSELCCVRLEPKQTLSVIK